jgi:GNAT superfamily N-acetyltransferase
MLRISALTNGDRAVWEDLARGYKEFYQSPTTAAEFDSAWSRLFSNTGIHGIGARLDGQLVGIAHFIVHASTWAPSVCYLQDLFTAPEARGKGVARALINEIADQARSLGAQRYYWLTQENNAVARILYNKIAKYNGFIRYDFAL